MDQKLRAFLEAHHTGGTLCVLRGYTPEDAGLPRPVLTALLAQRPLQYLASLEQRELGAITCEEFALHRDVLLAEYDRVLLVENPIYRGLLPVSVEIDAGTAASLETHFDADAPADAPLCDLSRCLRVYGNYCRTEAGMACCIPLPEEDGAHLEHASLITPADLPADCPDDCRAQAVLCMLRTEQDYYCMVRLLAAGRTVSFSDSGFAAGASSLQESLRVLCAAFPGRLWRTPACAVREAHPVFREARQLLSTYWGYPSFQTLQVYDLAQLAQGRRVTAAVSQEDIIGDLIAQAELCRSGQNWRDVFVTAPTGAGKSVMFQIPAIYLAEKHGLLTLVISPLIGLMNDQVGGMERRSYHKARTINSDISPVMRRSIAEEIRTGACDILYLSPESLLSRSDIAQLTGDREIGLLIVDEAHIVTTWGKQFRPDYWYLGDYVDKLRKVQQRRCGHAFVTATFTATATYGGTEDMYRETLASLHMTPDPITYLGCVRRTNIDIEISRVPAVTARREYEQDKFAALLAQIDRAMLRGEKVLVYFPTVGLLERFATHCFAANIGAKVARYHGKMSAEAKAESLHAFQTGERSVMLATKAFGMGIDIPDIAVVIHFAPTGNLCDYTQEIGRAARSPSIHGRAVYEHMPNDFKHINRLHGLSAIRRWQLIEVMRKILELYQNKRLSGVDPNTRRRNEMLVDAECFAYIFQNPASAEEQDTLAKVKTAMLLIQKDSETKGYAPFVMRPSPLFARGFFVLAEAAAARLLARLPGCAVLCDGAHHVWDIDLERIWAAFYQETCSFPRFKYLLYTRDSSLPFTAEFPMTPAAQVTVCPKAGGEDAYARLIPVLREILFAAARTGAHLNDADAAAQLAAKSGISQFRAETIWQVLLAAVRCWQEHSPRLHSGVMQRRSTQQGTDCSIFTPFISEFFTWLQSCYDAVRAEAGGTLYLPCTEAENQRQLTTALGFLESLGVLSFASLGGSGSQLYLYVNQTQALQLAARGIYRNRLLEKVESRHEEAVRLMAFLFQSGFSSEEIWDRIEDYFLGLPIAGLPPAPQTK